MTDQSTETITILMWKAGLAKVKSELTTDAIQLN
mgnify:CR=1 FL=1